MALDLTWLPVITAAAGIIGAISAQITAGALAAKRDERTAARDKAVREEARASELETRFLADRKSLYVRWVSLYDKQLLLLDEVPKQVLKPGIIDTQGFLKEAQALRGELLLTAGPSVAGLAEASYATVIVAMMKMALPDRYTVKDVRRTVAASREQYHKCLFAMKRELHSQPSPPRLKGERSQEVGPPRTDAISQKLDEIESFSLDEARAQVFWEAVARNGWTVPDGTDPDGWKEDKATEHVQPDRG